MQVATKLDKSHNIQHQRWMTLSNVKGLRDNLDWCVVQSVGSELCVSQTYKWFCLQGAGEAVWMQCEWRCYRNHNKTSGTITAVQKLILKAFYVWDGVKWRCNTKFTFWSESLSEKKIVNYVSRSCFVLIKSVPLCSQTLTGRLITSLCAHSVVLQLINFCIICHSDLWRNERTITTCILSRSRDTHWHAQTRRKQTGEEGGKKASFRNVTHTSRFENHKQLTFWWKKRCFSGGNV